ncbi:MAG: AraC family transcriptional regulator [Pseudomonadota bacterium]
MMPRLQSAGSALAPGASFVVRRHTTAGVWAEKHMHNAHELAVVEAGHIRLCEGGEAETLTPGTIIFLRPGDMHAFELVGPGACLTTLLFLSDAADRLVADHGADLEGLFFWSAAERPSRTTLCAERLATLTARIDALETSDPTSEQIEGFLLFAMTELITRDEAGQAEMPTWLVEACAAVRRPEILRGGASALVRETGRAHGHVCRQMRWYLDTTPSAFVNRRRSERAAHLLAESDLPISEIALGCGIENLSHFYRMFRRHYDLTPNAFRRLHRIAS